MSEDPLRPAATPPPRIDIDDPADLSRWAERLGVDEQAVINTVIDVGPHSDAVAQRLRAARGAAD
ncbi:hypothetical protein SGCZBJ_01480 [Caulobacter zeae]|uniref:DUF3606 domain-containing protein n=1 Tax=Caulobacter zeae TaxID=2055137 RepID=A0A2N5DRM4_9CAUL|nr:DUF3606 domain-containing protein [Caulobacter zeae]PLR28716.1 hypothetical protein SGCZBJ_01480 [Caulobacter zeae]